jgi:membrane associated rhomboid family serine protease
MSPLPQIDFRRTPVTIILAMAIIALEVVCTLDATRLDYYYLRLKLGITWEVWAGELWQPFTTTLLHANLIHAGFNLYWLWVFGQALETVLGSYRFFGLCVLLAYGSMMPEFVVTAYHGDPNNVVAILGFSGVVYGLFGMLWMGRRWRPDFQSVCDAGTVRLMIGWLLLCIVLTYTNVMPVANIAHGAGLGLGVLYGLAIFEPQRRRRLLVWLPLAAATTLLALALLLGFPGHAGYQRARYRWHPDPRRIEEFLREHDLLPPTAKPAARPPESKPADNAGRD